MPSSYRQLIVWQKAMELVEAVYVSTDSFPKEEQYGLISQMRRAAISIPSNIAQCRLPGCEKDFRHFLLIAFASGGELETQIELASRLLKTKHLDFQPIRRTLDEVMKMLNK